MTPERLTEITAKLDAQLFPHGGFAEVRELVEAVRWQRKVINALHKALFCGESTGRAVDLSVAGHIAILQALGNEYDARWATERYALILAAADLYKSSPTPEPQP
jgi:hypothetical protein